MTVPAVAHSPVGLAARWRSLPRWARVLLVAGAAVVGVNAGLAALETITGGAEPGGPASSSYATAPAGLAAFADLLEARGHPVGRIRTGLHEAGLDPATTLVVADVAGLPPGDVTALARFVGGGGRLLVTGSSAELLVEAVLGPGLTWSPSPATPARSLVPVPEVTGVGRVAGAGLGSFADAGPTLPVLAGTGADRGRVLATVAGVGPGRVVALADPSPLQNRFLDEADNAAFGLAAVGEPGRPVRFAEAPHGFGVGRGFAALPARWRWALAGVALAVAVWMWSRGRRLGPAEELERSLPPPRRAYVDALAATLARTGQPAESMAPLQAAARRRLQHGGGLPPGAGEEDLARAAARLGLAAEDLDALLRPVGTDAEAVAAARALAGLEGRSR